MATDPKYLEINLADRYIIVVTVPEDVGREQMNAATEWACGRLNEWWEREEKFFVVGVLPGVSIAVRRLEDGDE